MNTGRVQARIDPHLQRKAESIIKRYGYNPSKLITVVYSFIVQTGELPIEVKKIPTELTLETVTNARRGKNVIKCKDMKDLFHKLDH